MFTSDMNSHETEFLNSSRRATLIMLTTIPNASVRFDAISAQWTSPAPNALPTQMSFMMMLWAPIPTIASWSGLHKMARTSKATLHMFMDGIRGQNTLQRGWDEVISGY